MLNIETIQDRHHPHKQRLEGIEVETGECPITVLFLGRNREQLAQEYVEFKRAQINIPLPSR